MEFCAQTADYEPILILRHGVLQTLLSVTTLET